MADSSPIREDALLEVRRLKKFFPIQRGLLRKVVGHIRAVDPTEGQVLFRAADGSVVDIAAVPRASLRPLRREMQMIFQDPFSSLNSRMTLLEIVGEPLEVNGVGNRQER